MLRKLRGLFRSRADSGGGSGKRGLRDVNSSRNPRDAGKREPALHAHSKLLESVSVHERICLKDAYSDNPLQKVLGMRGLASTKKKEFIPIFQDLLSDKTEFRITHQESQMHSLPVEGTIRGEAIWSLTALGSKESVPLIEKMLKDNNESVRDAARESLMYLTKDLKYHRLYKDVRDPSFFDRTRKDIPRVEFKKDGSRIILLGGPKVGREIIRVIPEGAYNAWLKVLNAEEAWRKEGFRGVIPIEPMVRRKDGRPKIKKLSNGRVAVWTKVVGVSLPQYAVERAIEKGNLSDLRVSRGDFTAVDRFQNPDGLFEEFQRICEVMGRIGVRHGHEHASNCQVRIHNGSPMPYVIDLDRATITH